MGLKTWYPGCISHSPTSPDLPTDAWGSSPPYSFTNITSFLSGFTGGSDGEESPAMQETRVRSLGQEDALEKGMATHSGILAWRILWTGEPGRLQSMGSQRVGHHWTTNTSLHQFVILVPCHVLVFAPMLRFSSLCFCLSRQHRTSVAVLFSTEIFEPFGFPFQRQKVSDGLWLICPQLNFVS